MIREMTVTLYVLEDETDETILNAVNRGIAGYGSTEPWIPATDDEPSPLSVA